MWYVFVPSFTSMQRFFTGITDNIIRFRSYYNMMEESGVENIMPVTEYRSYDDCIDAVKYVLSAFPNYGDLYGTDTLLEITTQSDLITVNGSIPENYITVSEIAYDYFKEVVVTPEEVRKMMHQLYGLCHSYSVGALGYLHYNSLDGKVIKRVIECICKLWDSYGAVYKQRGSIGMITGCPDYSNNSYLWSLFDETVYLKIWVEMEIKSAKFGLPLSCI